jgi:hypothetical protein
MFLITVGQYVTVSKHLNKPAKFGHECQWVPKSRMAELAKTNSNLLLLCAVLNNHICDVHNKESKSKTPLCVLYSQPTMIDGCKQTMSNHGHVVAVR